MLVTLIDVGDTDNCRRCTQHRRNLLTSPFYVLNLLVILSPYLAIMSPSSILKMLAIVIFLMAIVIWTLFSNTLRTHCQYTSSPSSTPSSYTCSSRICLLCHCTCSSLKTASWVHHSRHSVRPI